MNNHIHVLSRAVILNKGFILLCKTTGLVENFYFLPGGHVEHGESAEQTLVRELQEETGLSFRLERFLGCLEYSYDPNKVQHAKCHTHDYTFFFEATSDFLPNPKDPLNPPEGHLELSWVLSTDLSNIDLRPVALKKLISDWLSLNLHAAFQSSMVT